MSTRSRVLSFMSSFSSKDRDAHQRSPTPTGPTPIQTRQESFPRYDATRDPATPARAQPQYNMDGESPQPRVQRERAPSRPMSMVQTYQPPLMDVNQDTLPELQPIFTFLNSHANKLYQEGYFLKLDDQNTHGRPNADRTWTECFAQLVGTVLSLWDAAELDAAGQDGEVLPKFINLTDASIKMITSLPTRSDSEAPLQNVLSISTAGKNRYLLHFNSHHSLIQWTAGIRLAMFEHATLQEAYTGALIAGKGKALNNINIIMDRAKMPTADWARVRFGAGTPWRRCWCVITPPDEKEVQKLQKQMNKKKSAYDRSRPPMLKGDIKFYDSKKTKKMKPIATISDAYSAFAIYPQSKPLIDASTLVKVEGSIVIHSNPPTTSEGFVFVMPEVHPAVTGFEMMLRWLFPVFDTFGLYGRPGRLVADIQDPRSLMFAMPKHRRYGYLEILDVSGLILEQGSENWKEGEWRKRMKELTGKRMTAIESGSQRNSRYSSRRSTRNSFGPSRSRVQFDDGASVRSSPSITWGNNQDPSAAGLPRTDSAPAAAVMFTPPRGQPMTHQRSVSETHGLDRYQQNPGGYDGAYEVAPPPPPHVIGVASSLRYRSDMPSTPERLSSEDEQVARGTPVRELQDLQKVTSPEPVAAPPAFAHGPGSMPISKPYHSPELRRANSRMSSTTLDQLAGAGGVAGSGYHTVGDDFRAGEDQGRHDRSQYSEESGQRGVLSDANTNEYSANDRLNQGLVAESKQRFSFEQPSPISPPTTDHTNYSQPPPQYSYDSSHNLPSRSQVDISPPASAQGQPLNSRTYEPPQVYASQEIKSPPSRHGHQSSAGSSHSIASQPRLQTNPSVVARKPVPARHQAIETPTSAETASSTGSFRRHVMDEPAFDMIGNGDRGLTPLPDAPLHRQSSGVSSIYEDSASTTSPDYASTRRSMDTQKSVEKPRAGVMKTVGQLEKTTSNESRGTGSSFNIDFGPTLNLASDRPIRSPSPGPAQGLARGPSPGPGIPSYPADRAPRQQSPARGLDNAINSPSRNIVTPENAHYRNNSSESRTVAWQPGMAMNQNVGQAITPEQFVQQRATMATATPMYAHQRQQSGNTLRANTPTPPLPRNRSSDFVAQQGHSRNNSADLLQRPSSRGASVALGPSGSGDIASTLSAREQEHIARVTGQPLINMAQNAQRQAPGAGLVGAIEARQKEKEQMKQGINSQAVQQAITQRQQQAIAQQQQQALYQQQYADQMTQAQYGTMGQYPQNFAAQAQRRQSWVSPAANVYAQGGGFSAPSTVWTTSPDGRQSPSQFPPRQQQYFPPQQGQPQQGQGQGRGNAGFHGHGY
ncbi:related to CAF120 CCR4 Associated Factor 120 kDa [Phialocephala subalpina]|uniref:Related to CAF120 CCR4 Associated Factor 120 kDa n=1 Tax=Phialocephala subalpina TaxID=576137 RepID=A0A1L7WDX0_9HELO|nr:related to CAF120 CCR4 Associated Factor 120 kDa [Phialocephala subalpina]